MRFDMNPALRESVLDCKLKVSDPWIPTEPHHLSRGLTEGFHVCLEKHSEDNAFTLGNLGDRHFLL